MTITDCALLVADPAPPGAPALLLRLDTDEGHSAWAEPAPEVEAGELHETLAEATDMVCGQAPADRGALWERLAHLLDWYGRPAPAAAAALSALDLALWQLAARQAGWPLYQLLGGRFFPRLDTYLPLAPGEEPAQPPAGGVLVTAGGDAEDAVALVEDLRRRWGDQPRLLVDLRESAPDRDTGQRLAQRLSAAEVYACLDLFPLLQGGDYAEVAAQVELTLAVGGQAAGLGDFRRLTRNTAFEAVVAEVRRCGGLTGAQRICTLASAERKLVALVGGAWSPTLLLIQHLASTSGWYLPVARGRDGALEQAPACADGFLELPDQPGAGATLREEFLAAYQPL